MSRLTLMKISKFIAFTFLFLIACAFQTHFWPYILGFLPAPQISLVICIYIAYKWSEISSLFFIYFLGFLALQFTGAPLKMILFSLLGMTTFVWFFKNRIHSTSVYYFAILTLTASFVFNLSYLICSYMLEDKPTQFLFLQRTLELGLNFVTSIILYPFLNRVFQFFNSDSSEQKNNMSQLHPAFSQKGDSDL